MNIKADLHLHTTASDGKLSSEELVKLAINENLDIIAVTDHDTTLGIAKAQATAENSSLRIIPGIELSTQHNGESIHVLGYFRDSSYKNKAFQEAICEMKDHRDWRSRKIIENLKIFFGIELNYEEVLSEAKGVIARPHIARAIQKAGYNYEWEYIFEKLIGKNSPAYVPNKKLSTEDGIKLLKTVNAVTVIAHPILIRNTAIEDMISLDFDGIEAFYWQHSGEDTKRFIELAVNNNKLITGGSDFHGGDAGDTKHGFIGKVFYDSNFAEKFISCLY